MQNADPSNSPKCIIQGSMTLTPEREKWVVDNVLQRFKDVRKEMGWQGKSVNGTVGYDNGSFLGKRWNFSRMYEGDFSHRAGQDALYEQFNTSYNIPQQSIRVFKAKACEKLLNTDPFTSIGPQGKEDSDDGEAENISIADKYFQDCLTEAEAKRAYRQAIEGAGVRGESIVKIIPKTVEIENLQEKKILMIGSRELRDSSGRPVFHDDEFEDDAEMQGFKVLKRDRNVKLEGVTDITQLPTRTRKLPVREERRSFEIIRLPWQDCYCSPVAPDIHSKDFFYVYDLDVDDLLLRADKTRLSASAQDWLDKMRQATCAATSAPKSDSGQPVSSRGEQSVTDDARPKRVQVVEAWLKIDADEDGYAENFHISICLEDDCPIYYDYLQEASVTGKKPFEVIPLIEVQDRWWGIGFYELLANQHEFVDRQRNRIDARNGSGGRIMWQVKNAIVETQFGVPLQFNSDMVYTIDPDNLPQGQEAFGAYQMPIETGDLWQMQEKEIQNAKLLGGTLTPADGEFSGLPANDTLGGMQLQAQESDQLNGDMLQDIMHGMQKSLTQAAEICFNPDWFDFSRAVDVTDEATAQKLQEWIDSGEPRNLFRRVNLTLKKDKTQQQLVSNQQITTTILPQWEALAPDVKLRWFSVFSSMLTSLGVDNPEEVLGDPAVLEEQQAAMQAQVQAEQSQLALENGTEQIPAEDPAASAGDNRPLSGLSKIA